MEHSMHGEERPEATLKELALSFCHLQPAPALGGYFGHRSASTIILDMEAWLPGILH